MLKDCQLYDFRLFERMLWFKHFGPAHHPPANGGEFKPIMFEHDSEEKNMNEVGKKWIISPLVILMFFPGIGFADYIIHLKDGRSFTTSKYVEEGNVIKFDRYGGFVGLPKDDVVEIETVTVDESKSPPVVEQSENKAVATSVKKAAEASVKKDQKKETEDEQIAFMDEKRRILEGQKRASEAFKAAKTSGKRDKKDAAWQEIFLFREKMSNLRERVIKAGNGTLPSWWDQIY